LSSGKSSKRTFPGLPAWVSAAAIILLVIGVFWIIRPWTTPSNNQVAHETVENAYPEGDDRAVDSERPARARSLDSPEPLTATRETEQSISQSSPPLTGSPAKSTETAKPKAISGTGNVVAGAAKEENVVSESKNQTGSPPGVPAQMGRTIAGAADDQTSSYTPEFLAPEVKGVVLDNRGTPLYGVDVQLKGTVVKTQTDYLGNFTLDIPERNKQNALVFFHKDYPAVEANISDGDSLIVRLQDTAASEEQSITTFSQDKVSKEQRPGTRSLATPAIGERSYNKYIRQNLKYPASASAPGIHGPVVLEFDVATDGTPHNFRVIESLGYGCDEEAIRLIREGPKWNARNAQVSIGRWKIDF
jgi:TonB family protein